MFNTRIARGCKPLETWRWLDMGDIKCRLRGDRRMIGGAHDDMISCSKRATPRWSSSTSTKNQGTPSAPSHPTPQRTISYLGTPSRAHGSRDGSAGKDWHRACFRSVVDIASKASSCLYLSLPCSHPRRHRRRSSEPSPLRRCLGEQHRR